MYFRNQIIFKKVRVPLSIVSQNWHLYTGSKLKLSVASRQDKNVVSFTHESGKHCSAIVCKLSIVSARSERVE